MRAVALISLLLLTACGESGVDENRSAGQADAGPSTTATTLQPGQWEARVEVVSLASPGPLGEMTPTIPPRTIRACLTPDQASRPDARFFTGQQRTPGCEGDDLTMGDGRVRGVVTCGAPDRAVRSSFDGRFSPTDFAILQRSVTGSGDAMVEAEIRVTGRRTGDCAAG